MRSPPLRNSSHNVNASGSVSPSRGALGPRGVGQQTWSGPPEVRGSSQNARPNGAGGGVAGPVETPQRRDTNRGGGGGLMSFIFGGGQQERQSKNTPHMVKLPQVSEEEGVVVCCSLLSGLVMFIVGDVWCWC